MFYLLGLPYTAWTESNVAGLPFKSMVTAGAETGMRLVFIMVCQVPFTPDGIIPARLAKVDRGDRTVLTPGIRGDDPHLVTA
jgi:hypothetical protein